MSGICRKQVYSLSIPSGNFIQERIVRAYKQIPAAESIFREAGLRPNNIKFPPQSKTPYLTILLDILQNEPDLHFNDASIVRHLLIVVWENEKLRQQAGWIPFKQMEVIFGKLAFAMMDENQSTDVSLNDALQYIGSPLLLGVSFDSDIINLHDNQVRFSQPWIQEYLAAVELKNVGVQHRIQAPKFEEHGLHLARRIPSKWDQVFVNVCEIDTADKIILEVLKVNPHLAAQCIGSNIVVSDLVIEAVTKALISRLVQERTNYIMGAIDAIVQIGSAAVPELRRLLSETNPYGRSAAAMALEYIGDASSVSELEAILTDLTVTWYFGVTVFDYAAGALKNIKTAEAQEIFHSRSSKLIPLLNDPDVHRRCIAIIKLGEIGDSKTIPALIEKLSDTESTVDFYINKRVCDEVVLALENINTPEAIEAIHNWRKRHDQ